jgi:uncharacterized protein DUF3455
MKRNRFSTSPLIALFLALVSSSTMAADPVPAAPANLRAEPGEPLTLLFRATGVQIYTCGFLVDHPSVFKWLFTAPEADLFDQGGAKIGRHYAGPTWELSDGSKVIGELKARDPGPDPNAIPWFLLTAKPGTGSGRFARTHSIQRLQTTGGAAPGDSCSQQQAGVVTRVPYTATYVFYDAKP